jgi:pyruvate formate lyase activating enzyme
MDIPPTPASTLTRAREIAMQNGVRYAYVGNVHDPAADSTWCHQCGHKLIGRDWYVLSDWNITADGKCKHCQTPVAGIFEAHPGDWGARRQPVRLHNFST